MMGRQARLLVQTVIIVLFVYFVIKFIGVLISSPSHSPTYSIHKTDNGNTGIIGDSGVSINGTKESTCQTMVQLVVLALDPAGCRGISQLLHTILHRRRHGLHIHVMGNVMMFDVISKLLETWTLPHVSWSFIDVEALTIPDFNKEAYLIGIIPFVLPPTITKVIYLSHRVRLLEELEKLWDHFTYIPSTHMYGVLPQKHLSKKVNNHGMVDILLLRVALIRREVFPRGINKLREKHKDTYNHDNAQDLLRALLGYHPYLLPCTWGVSVGSVDEQCQIVNVKGMIWSPSENHFTGNEIIENAKEHVISIVSSDGDIYRHHSVECYPSQAATINLDPSSKCLEFRYASAMKKRTHLYYIAEAETYRETASEGNDIVLLTQFTLDRFSTFERFMENWEGPVIVVLYITDLEALTLPELVATSDVLKNRHNIAYHLVYKRGKFYPINYLRNVAVNQTRSPYLLFVDVDLVVNRGVYKQLRNYVSQYMLHRNNLTLVIPAFEALTPLDVLPTNKSDLLTLMAQDKVIGYRMNRGWNLGHRPTNYPLWMKSNTPYKAIWKDAYEPYMVLANHNVPLYREILLERMGDKIAYARDIYANGFEFLVLPDIFILHLPHPISKGTNMWKRYPGYGRCGGVLFEEYRALLKYHHPDVIF